MDNMFVAESPLGYTVACSKETWYNHITPAEAHPIMLGNEKNVISTIEDPEKIFISSQTSNKYVYFKSTPYQVYGKEKIMYTKVIVENNINCSEVKSAWPQNTMTGGIGGVVYDKTKL